MDLLRGLLELQLVMLSLLLSLPTMLPLPSPLMVNLLLLGT
uniref:Uncharacterized protein n=1 Tax=Picea glauca TaxID=3330 RepID=A0A101M5B6_PICGL|nr:hypothetical protein ABT39_MTgene1203 [Picea glauca]QHR86722.1 hypothetical protein Q903MT_gene726 [Picea sitchensis]